MELYERVAELARLHGQASPLPPAQVPDILYHYTHADGLIGVLSAGGFWSTDYRFLNDKSELYHTEALIRKVVAEQHVKCSDDLETKLLSAILEDPSDTAVSPSFIFSLSEERDSLTQWRAYSRDGQGFTIGFRAHDFLAQDKWEGGFDLRKVEYREASQARGIRLALEALVSEIPKWRGKCSDDDLVTDLHEGFKLIAMAQSAINKHSSFRSEKEWRTVSIVDDGNVLVRARGGELVPYILIEAAEPKPKSKLPIASIGIGPGFSFDNQAVAVRGLCKQFGYGEVDVYEADSPFRRL